MALKKTPELLSKLVKIGLLKEEAEYILGCKITEDEYHAVYKLHWRNDREFILKCLKRTNMSAYKKYKLTINRLRQTVRIQMADMIAREMPPFEEITGYPIEDLYDHLSAIMPEGFSWAKRNEWHIDHIKPRSSFAVSQMRDCFALANLQVLPAKDNLKKGRKHA